MPPKTALNVKVVDKATGIKEFLAKKSAKSKLDAAKKNAVYYKTIIRDNLHFKRADYHIIHHNSIEDYVFVKDLSEKVKLTERVSLEQYINSKGEPWKQFDKYKEKIPVVIGINYLSKETLQLIIKMKMTSGGMYDNHVLPLYESSDNKTLWMYAIPVDPNELNAEDYALMKTHMDIATKTLEKFELCHAQVEISIFIQQDKKHFLLGRLHQLQLKK